MSIEQKKNYNIARKYVGKEFLEIGDKIVKTINQIKKYNITNTVFLTFSPNCSFESPIPILLYDKNAIEILERLLKPRDFDFTEDTRFDAITISPPVVVFQNDPVARFNVTVDSTYSKTTKVVCISPDEFKEAYENNNISSLDLTGNDVVFYNHLGFPVEGPIVYNQDFIFKANNIDILGTIGDWSDLAKSMIPNIRSSKASQALNQNEAENLFDMVKNSITKGSLFGLDFYKDFMKMKPSSIKIYSARTQGANCVGYVVVCLEQVCSGFNNLVFYRYASVTG